MEKTESKTAPRRLRKPPELRGRDKKATLNARGQEMVSNEKLEAALKFVAEPTVSERIRAAIRSDALRREAEAAGMESFEEADDFDIGDDYDPTSPYEEIFEGSVVDDVMKKGEEARKKAEEIAKKRKEDGSTELEGKLAENLHHLTRDELKGLLDKVADRSRKVDKDD